MPVGKDSKRNGKSLSGGLRLSGLFLRRRSDREFHSYIPLLDYHPDEYEVLLRVWGSEPFSRHLSTFSGPMIVGEDPEEMLLSRSNDWTNNLANKAEISNYKPMKGQKALFLSVHGGGCSRDPISGLPVSLGTMLCYIVPIKQSNSSLISLFPDLPNYPKFYNLESMLHQMTRRSIKIHPYTREMLSTLDHWLREQHAVAGGINSLFAPSLQSRMKLFVMNPMFTAPQAPTASPPQETPDQSFSEEITPLISSTPVGLGVNNTRHETTGFTLSTVKESDITAARKHQQVDMIVENPVFGSGLRLKKVDTIVVNDYFGFEAPNYDALKESRGGKWALQVTSDGLPDWTELFPLHKFCCEGNVKGVRQCIQLGMTPDERDTDSWSPLHYACWYGELECVKALVEEMPASIGIQNSSGSTPLHLAAGTGHVAVVSYLLTQRSGQAVKAALDNDGKSPLAVCLDSKMNDWTKTARILKDAYSNSTSADLSFPLPLLPYSPSSAVEDFSLMLNGLPDHLKGNEDLELRGSLGNLREAKSPKKAKQKSKPQDSKTIRRQRVNLGIGHHQVVHFSNGRETDCKDIITSLHKLINLPKNFHNLFTLWISSKSLELQLGDTDQPLKLIYGWKKMLSQYSSAPTIKGESELPTLHLWRNVFFPPAAEQNISDPMALEFLYADAHRHVVKSQYPCSENDAFYLAGITLQIMYGDYTEGVHGAGFLKDKLHNVLPSHMTSSRRKVEYERKVLARYAEMSQYGFSDMKFLYQSYLKQCWQWPYYGAAFYEGVLHMKDTKLEIKGKLSRKTQLPVLVGINTSGFHLVNCETNTLLASVPLDGLDWDVSTAKQEMVVYNENRTICILIHSRKASLLYGVATRMKEQHITKVPQVKK